MRTILIKVITKSTDNGEMCMKIQSTKKFDDLVGIDNQGRLIGFQVDISILVSNLLGDTKAFTIIFQNENRTDGIMAYSDYGMDTANKFGCDADESAKLESFLDETEEYDKHLDILNELIYIADHCAKEQLKAIRTVEG